MPKKDDQIVQDTGEVSTEETPSGDTATENTQGEGGEQPTGQPLTREEIQQMIDQARKEAEESGFQKGSREMQGKKDREVAEAQRRARIAEESLAGYGTSGFDDPAQAELARRRAADTARQRAEYEESMRKATEKFDQDFRGGLIDFVTQAGIDPNDKRIDWAEDTKDYLAKQSRILASVNKIQAANKAEADAKMEQRLKALESKVSEEANSVDTGTSGGIGSGIPTNMEKFKKWVEDLPKEEYRKLKPKIDEMLRKGLIK
jgi:hypothetical protein